MVIAEKYRRNDKKSSLVLSTGFFECQTAADIFCLNFVKKSIIMKSVILTKITE